MKNSHVKSILGLGSVLALSIGLGSSAFAGPGPTYWTQREEIRAENAKKVAAANAASTAKPAAAPAMACPSCKTKIYEEAATPSVADKTKPRVVKVGVRHYCDSCKGTITRLPGGVSNSMQHNHGACATASCCTVT